MNHLTHNVEQRKQLFISAAIASHGNRYDYSKVIYTRAQEKVEIICKDHGSFWQVPDSHRKGVGCPKCGIEKSQSDRASGFSVRMTTEEFIAKAKLKHGNYYDYSKVVYTGKKNKVIITCPEHGDFEQQADNHYVVGAGCKTCGVKKAHAHFLATTKSFIEKSREVHKDSYDYSKTLYTGKTNPVTIVCPKKSHGEFTIDRAQWHYTNEVGCPKCSMAGTSKQEQELIEFVKTLTPNVITGTRKIIPPMELDIVLPELNIAIEYNGLYWHSEKAGKNSDYHLSKTKQCAEVGYRLIHIFEDEWVNKRNIVKSRLTHILKKATTRLYARKLEIRTVSSKEATAFFNLTHIQGGCQHSVAYGLYNGEELVACVSFGQNRFTSKEEVELIRFSSKCSVVGGFSKLFKFFLNQYPEVKEVISYSDKRWSNGEVYSKNGFVYSKSSQPSYFYVKSSSDTLERLNRVKYQKHKLPEILKVFNPLKTEVENMSDNGFFRIFDCGTDKWVYTKPVI